MGHEGSLASPFVSVVMPVHNGRRYLRRALWSVLQQTVRPAEIIVIDDGSTDDTRESVGDLLDRVTWLRHERSRGVSAARNTGIAASRTPFVALLDSDDYWVPTRLEEQLGLHSACQEAEVSFCDFRQVSESGDPCGWQGGLLAQLAERGVSLELCGSGGYLLGREVLWALVEFTSFMHPSTVFCRRDVFATAGGFDEELHGAEDLDLWIRMASSSKFAFLDKSLAVVEQRPNSLGRNHAKMAKGMLRAYTAALARYPEMPRRVRRAARRHCARQHISLAWQARQAGERSESRSHAWQAFRLQPTLVALRLLARSLTPTR